jgi:hypothetical protein
MANTLPGEGQTGVSWWNPWASQPDKPSVTRVPGYDSFVDTILRFIIEQPGASTDKEVYRALAEKQVDKLLADCKDVNTGILTPKV